MPLIKSGKQAIVDAVNVYATLGLTENHVTFGLPEVLSPEGPNGENTRLRITMNQSAPARGATIVRYTRLPFSEYFTEPDGVNPLIVPVPKNANFAYDVLSNLRQFCGMDISDDDLVDHEIDRVNMRLLLEASPNSLGWIGSVTAKLIDGDTVMSDVFGQTDLSTFFAYPNFNTNLGQASLYSYRYDFSDSATLLKSITADNLASQLPALAALLKSVTRDDWMVYRNPTEYNLNAAVFRYNGLNNNPQYLGNTNYSRVLVVELAFFSLKLGGLLYIHYNA